MSTLTPIYNSIDDNIKKLQSFANADGTLEKASLNLMKLQVRALDNTLDYLIQYKAI